MRPTDRCRVLHLAPWVDLGGSDKGTIDWFKWLDRERFVPSLITTQPSPNRRLADVAPYAEEVWTLPDLLRGPAIPAFIFDFLGTREIDVLHVMNARIGYELLPDLASLPRPPKVVVQLHVEERDRSGYVRLVCTRFGNLVDRFSVVSGHLADAVNGYGVPRSKIDVIRGGVDAEGEFSPAKVDPIPGLDRGALHVLYPGRLVEQKDPGLMVEIAALVAAQRDDVHFHVVGEGHLEDGLRAEVARRGIAGCVHFHPTSKQIARWYATCDVVLMTSVFEGVPYVVYEAMAMGVPVVVPALPGNVELLGGGGGIVIGARDDAAAYAAQLVRLADDRALRASIGNRGRQRALGELSVREMARRHEALYSELAEQLPPRSEPQRSPATAPVRFARSRTRDEMVSVVMPCFNHGEYVTAAVASVEAQSYPSYEIVIVDDGSTDDGTHRALKRLESKERVSVVRLPENRGPSYARNVALAQLRGRYVLPVDCDNLLLEDAMEALVEQLRSAGEQIGFIYPRLQFFGNRRDRFDPPTYNLFELLTYNYCDTCSLFDRDVFESGVRFDSDIGLGHEDWDLVLQLGARGIYGEPSHRPTMLYRKTGFTRSDEVVHAPGGSTLRRRRQHTETFGPTVDIKARWAPALTIAPLPAVEAGTDTGLDLARGLRAQTCGDVELLVRAEGHWNRPGAGPSTRRIPAALAATNAAAFRDALTAARGRYVLVTESVPAPELGDRALVEKLLRLMVDGPHSQVVAFCDAGLGPGSALRPLAPDATSGLEPNAVLIRRDEWAAPSIPAPDVDSDHPIASLLACLNAQHGLQIDWRQLGASRRPRRRASSSRPEPIDLAQRPEADPARKAERVRRLSRSPALPATPEGAVARWQASESWMPPMTTPLVRHRREDGYGWAISNSLEASPGFILDRVLGCVQTFQPPGTAELRNRGPEGFTVIPDAVEGAPMLGEPRHPDCLGFVERTAFTLLDPLDIAHDPATRSWVLVAGENDPLRASVDFHANVGYIEGYPNQPWPWPRLERHGHGFAPLIRAVDVTARRHRYALNELPRGIVSLELGALHTERQPDSAPLWVEDGKVVTESSTLPRVPSITTRARWCVAPLAWRGPWGPLPRARATGRRLLDARLPGPGPMPIPDRPADAYLWRDSGAGRRPLYAATHAVTGDQFLTPWPLEAADMGYRAAELLGYTSFGFSLTGDLDRRHAPIPWASRFGERTRDYGAEDE